MQEQFSYFSFLPTAGDQDAGSGGNPLRPALDAVPHSGGGQLLPRTRPIWTAGSCFSAKSASTSTAPSTQSSTMPCLRSFVPLSARSAAVGGKARINPPPTAWPSPTALSRIHQWWKALITSRPSWRSSLSLTNCCLIRKWCSQTPVSTERWTSVTIEVFFEAREIFFFLGGGIIEN